MIDGLNQRVRIDLMQAQKPNTNSQRPAIGAQGVNAPHSLPQATHGNNTVSTGAQSRPLQNVVQNARPIAPKSAPAIQSSAVPQHERPLQQWASC